MADLKQGQLVYPGEIRKYMLGGNAKFSIVDEYGDHITYRIKSGKQDRYANWSSKNQDRSIFFVSTLNGPSNESDYTYIGFLRQDINGEWVWHRKKGDSIGAAVFKAGEFEKFWRLLEQGLKIRPGYTFFHEGSCCVCGRTLTRPDSISSGIGPECAGGY